MLKKSLLLASLLTLASASAISAPHFYMAMENNSNKDATISFRQQDTVFKLEPALADETPLVAQTSTLKYAVNIEPMDPSATFDVVFKGKNECVYTVGFYQPGNPKVSMMGPGCKGGGYRFENHVLVFYISDITYKNTSGQA